MEWRTTWARAYRCAEARFLAVGERKPPGSVYYERALEIERQKERAERDGRNSRPRLVVIRGGRDNEGER